MQTVSVKSTSTEETDFPGGRCVCYTNLPAAADRKLVGEKSTIKMPHLPTNPRMAFHSYGPPPPGVIPSQDANSNQEACIQLPWCYQQQPYCPTWLHFGSSALAAIQHPML